MIIKEIDQLIEIALREDIGDSDITTEATISENQIAEGFFYVKQNGVIAGMSVAKRVFEIFDPTLEFENIFSDGDKVDSNTLVATVSGKAKSILTCERTALNFMQRMSGIATTIKKYVDAVSHTKTKIIDTRKTLPGFRLLDKMAVKLGGGANHRFGLFDQFLIKDNHLQASDSVANAIKLCEMYKSKLNKEIKIEIEVENFIQLEEALKCNADIIMLDNFSVEDTRKAVALINGKCLIESSGGITFETVKNYAETGVDFISVGALTHSVIALDISLEIKLLK